MNIVTAIDSFKGSISSIQAGEAVARGVRAVYPDAAVFVRPLADGGEGTVDAVVAGCNGAYVTVCVKNPLGELITARYGILPDSTAVMEMSAAAGITLIPAEQRNPLNTTTFGVGQMIADALSRGCRRIIMGIGGSVTNDGGIGMLQALGFDLLDKAGTPVALGGGGLAALAEIRTENALSALSECEFLVACDVTNPLCGEQGCSAIYGPQKGATPDMIRDMDAWLSRYAALASTVSPHADPNTPGAGAAGGIGFALLAFLHARLQSGISLVLETTGLEHFIKDADVVVTGEGRLDGQSAMGKAPVGVARLAKKHGKPVIAFSGCVAEDADVCNTQGIDAFFPVLRQVLTSEQAMEPSTAQHNLEKTAEQVFRLIRTFEK